MAQKSHDAKRNTKRALCRSRRSLCRPDACHRRVEFRPSCSLFRVPAVQCCHRDSSNSRITAFHRLCGVLWSYTPPSLQASPSSSVSAFESPPNLSSTPLACLAPGDSIRLPGCYKTLAVALRHPVVPRAKSGRSRNQSYNSPLRALFPIARNVRRTSLRKGHTRRELSLCSAQNARIGKHHLFSLPCDGVIETGATGISLQTISAGSRLRAARVMAR